MSLNVMQALRAFQEAVAAGDVDAAAVAMHRLPDVAKPAARAELARLRGESDHVARFSRPRDDERGAPSGVALRSRTA